MLPQEARLASSAGFRAVYGRGRSYATDLIVVYVLPRPGGKRARFGFVAGRKVGGAVKRNRAKRLMREAARAMLARISGSYDIVVIGKPAIAGASFAEVLAHLGRILDQAGVLSGSTG